MIEGWKGVYSDEGEFLKSAGEGEGGYVQIFEVRLPYDLGADIREQYGSWATYPRSIWSVTCKEGKRHVNHIYRDVADLIE